MCGFPNFGTHDHVGWGRIARAGVRAGAQPGWGEMASLNGTPIVDLKPVLRSVADR